MTEAKFLFIKRFCIPARKTERRQLIIELVNEIDRLKSEVARLQHQKNICRSLAQIYSEITFKLEKKESA